MKSVIKASGSVRSGIKESTSVKPVIKAIESVNESRLATVSLERKDITTADSCNLNRLMTSL